VLVEIYSDVVCPWCYIGKRRFEQALARFDGEVEVLWRPFQLDPTAPLDARPVRDVYEQKFGGTEQATRIVEHVTAVAASEGLEFRLDRALRANTFAAHRLLWLAAREGVQSRVNERLLQAYFREGADVSDHATLATLGAEAGLHAVDVAAWLESHEGVEEVRHELGHGIELGISAVPTFVFEGRWAVSGAHDPDTMLSVLQQVAARTGAPAGAGDACEGDACAC
jgi:predicted DsbA family dithiol-disulfide isomerase